MLAVILAAAVVSLPARSDTKPPPMVHASGSVTVVQDDGRVVCPRLGSIKIWLRQVNEWHPQVVSIVDGRWSADVLRDHIGVDLGRVLVDGREAYIAEGVWPSDPRTQRPAWVVRHVAPVELRVVDARTRVPIAGFEVRESSAQWFSAFAPRGLDDGWVIPQPRTSPFRLPAWTVNPDPGYVEGAGWHPLRTFWVKAEGMAWSRVDADFSKGGNVVAELEPSGSLRVLFARRPDVHSLLVVRSEGQKRALAVGRDDAEVVLDDLPCGLVDVVLLSNGMGRQRLLRLRRAVCTPRESIDVHL